MYKGWHIKSEWNMLYVDWAIEQFRKQLVSIIVSKGDEVENCRAY